MGEMGLRGDRADSGEMWGGEIWGEVDESLSLRAGDAKGVRALIRSVVLL